METSFNTYRGLLAHLYQHMPELTDDYAAQGYQEAIERKTEALLHGRYGYKKNFQASVALNNFLVIQGNQQAIERKMWALFHGNCGYKKDTKAAVALNESLIEQGNTGTF